MAVYNGLQMFGIGIENANTRFQGIGIESANTRFQGIAIDAHNFYNNKITVLNKDNEPVSGATVAIVSTQTHVNNYEGDITATTDANGQIEATGSSTTGTTVTVTATGYETHIGSLQGLDLSGYNQTQTIVLSAPSTAPASKKIYTTNKGNVLINPNDTILIELD
tara:strand:+ start:175 stop:669 length:495 start_codon:yes stop_codon:yes gene_type:complete